MTSAAQDSANPVPAADSDAAQSASALDQHTGALIDIFERLEEGESVDLFSEGIQCSLRLARTTGQFLWYWGNMAKLWLIDSDTPRYYPPPPVTDGSFSQEFADFSLTDSPTASLRRRGDSLPLKGDYVKVPNNPSGQYPVTVAGPGIPRGLYELKLVVAATGAEESKTIYIDPTA